MTVEGYQTKNHPFILSGIDYLNLPMPEHNQEISPYVGEWDWKIEGKKIGDLILNADGRITH